MSLALRSILFNDTRYLTSGKFPDWHAVCNKFL